MKALLAIIVPVYNVEKYLPACIDSILSQTFVDFKLLLVDDGSTDSCGQICDSYAATDSRIHVIHKPNGGVSSARNAALNHIPHLVGGGCKWLTFIDSDDFISSDFLYNLLKLTTEECELDLVHGGCTNYWESSSTCSIEQEYEPTISNDKRLLLEKVRGLSPAKLFSAEIIKKNGLRFDEHVKIAEDMIFTIEYIRYVGKYAFSSERGYYYRRHSSSATQSSHNREYSEARACFNHFYKAVTDYKNTHSIKHSTVRDKQLSQYVLNIALTLYRNRYPRKERLTRLRTDFSTQELSLLRIGVPNKINNILAKILLHRQYILFDTIAGFLFYIKHHVENNRSYIKRACR